MVGGNSKNSNLTRSGNGNTVEVYANGGGDNIVNMAVSFEADNSALEDSNNNVAKFYIGKEEGVKLSHSNVVDGKNANDTATMGHS